MEDKLHTMEGKLYTTATSYNTEITIDNYITADKVQEKEEKINKKIKNLESKISKQKTKYEKKIKELEAAKWKYEIGDIVLYDGWRKVLITDYLDRKPYAYLGKLLDINNGKVSFREDELTYFDPNNYDETLIHKIEELQLKLKLRL